MRVLAYSDLHRNTDAAREIVAAAESADLVIGAGDFASAHKGLDEVLEVLKPIAPKSIYVPGNNETLAALELAVGDSGAEVLHGSAVTRQGKMILGLGGAVPPLPPLPWGSWDLSEEEAAEMLDGFDHADLMVLHSPPKGIADEIAALGSVGSVALRDAIARIAPALAVCGHVHDCWGQSGTIGRTRVQNLGPTVNWFEI